VALWRSETLKFSADPELVVGVTDLVGLYPQPGAASGGNTRARGGIGRAMTTARDTGQRPAAIGERRAELDLLRTSVVAGLIVFHSAVVFASGTSWFVKDRGSSLGFTVLLLWGSLWGMPLLFVVSGMAARQALGTRSVRAFVRERLARLLVPLVVGLVVLVPPMFYLERRKQPGFDESYWRFWADFLNIRALVPGLFLRGAWTSGGVVFDPAHLWFLGVLLLFSIMLLPVFWYLGRPRGVAIVSRAAGLVQRHVGTVLWVAAVPMVLVETAFGPDVNTGGWERLVYAIPLLYGYLIASDRRFEVAVQRARSIALPGAVAATVVLVGWAGVLRRSGIDVMSGAAAGWSALQALAGRLWIVAILGYAGAVMTRRSADGSGIAAAPDAPRRARSRQLTHYANEAVLPCYLLHEPVIVATAWLIVRWHVPILGKYLLLVVLSLAGTLVVYEALIRRFRLIRPLFGMRPDPTGRVAAE
jgi:peptidoglycan/LPS O-acetylase OafA/YrhL